MVLKATDNDRRYLALCHDEFHGHRSVLCRSETKCRFYLYPLQRSDRSSAHARQTLSIKEKKHTCVIFRSLSATYALLCLFIKLVLIENPAACEIRCVIRFLNAKKVKPIEMYRQICEVYGQNAMSDSMVRRWVRQFNEGRSEVHDEERSGNPSLITEELVHAIDEKIDEKTVSLQLVLSLWNFHKSQDQ
ncbi:histone-lysine N-methyltransferase SETMAR [Trichonephila clavipes]|nr:histone-lysine N-methyltransferase SETMAR [Trichonephila clavipes]